jgi:hypothetical protein
MRTREKIMQGWRERNGFNAATVISEFWTLQLEVLLDIRELLQTLHEEIHGKAH